MAGSTYQILITPNNSTYIGSGKVAEVARAARALNVETVIFDDELSPGQLRNLDKAFNKEGEVGSRPVKVCDRTALILDIFSQRAQTKEGKLQVRSVLSYNRLTDSLFLILLVVHLKPFLFMIRLILP